MQRAKHVFAALHKLGLAHKPVTRIYRQLYNQNLYLGAYAKIYPNRGALTPGTTDETVDGMSLPRIDAIIDDMRHERFKWSPARRSYIPKKNGGKRPLAITNFRDKLVQEVLRALLSAYYEPRFSANSHGFRPQRGCHTALGQIVGQFTGTVWFIEGDIKGCFDNIDHDILMDILSRNIHDTRFLNLIRSGLEAGIMNGWRYERTYSGVPQGGPLSPVLSNIYLNELDQYVAGTLIPEWTRGKKRRAHKPYQAVSYQLRRARERGDVDAFKAWKAKQRQLPSQDPNDPNYRRLWFVRYADDYLLGFIGAKREAETIKSQLAQFLATRLNLQQSPTKTLITHAKTEQAHFLGYAVSVYHANEKQSIGTQHGVKRRSANGRVRLGIPKGLVREMVKPYRQHGVTTSRKPLTRESVAAIIDHFQTRFRGIAEYYKFAVDRSRLGGLKGVMQEVLVKTLAQKLGISVAKVYQTYRDTKEVNGKTYRILVETVEAEDRTYRFEWGGIPLTYEKPGTAKIDDAIPKPMWSFGGELVQRLKANRCEVCGSTENVEVHHVRKLADLKKRWRGRKKKPNWVKYMIARRRKTLVVCEPCHDDIHAGRMDRPIRVDG